ncbi:MAG: F0F1 ATP synthase subunit A [Planctomycetota bacterium]|jgi:F-type H+-transporting ATPase subunit a|nr:F0F1 ATP synthase subunit A [Planctomycetota bacterium]
MHLSPDAIVLWQYGPFKINGTIAYTWALMLLLVVGSLWVTRRLSTGAKRSRWKSLVEIVITGIDGQMRGVGLREPRKYLDFLGTLFLFVAVASLCTVIPGYHSPTGSLSTTAALAISVFVAVPFYGIRQQGLGSYLKSYTEPTPLMLPFNILGEISRTLALAIRMFGNMMSEGMIAAILLTLTPLLFPVVMTVLGLFTGMVQAYIFSILAAVYIAAATRVGDGEGAREKPESRPDAPTGAA